MTDANDNRLDHLSAIVAQMFDLSLLKSVTFVLVGFSGIIRFTGTFHVLTVFVLS